MFSFFNRKTKRDSIVSNHPLPTITKLYEELKPADRIKKLFEDYIENDLRLAGFIWIKSQQEYRRKLGEFNQKLCIAKSKWNRSNEVVSFYILLSVQACKYSKWHQEQYKTIELNESVRCFSHYTLPGWISQFPKLSYDLARQDNRKVFDDIHTNLFTAGFKFLEEYSDYEKAADNLMNDKQYGAAPMIIDFYILSNKNEKAYSAANHLLNYFRELSRVEMIAKIELRLSFLASK